MSDIVERLRQCDENFELAQEAADEIERLHAALEKLLQASMTAYHERLAQRRAARPVGRRGRYAQHRNDGN
jgi:hypothetical protein